MLGGVVTLATVLAYTRQPAWKAALAMSPVPFSLATLALGLPVSTTHVLGLYTILLFYALIRWLYLRWRVPILPAIVVAALAYTGVGMGLKPFLPVTSQGFWLAIAATIVSGVMAYRWMPVRREPEHCSELPVVIKSLLVALVVVCVILLKKRLAGFAALFPVVGVIAAYESRHSLWTIMRAAALMMLTITPMMVVIRLATPYVGLGFAILLGWIVHVPVAAYFLRDFRRRLPADLS